MIIKIDNVYSTISNISRDALMVLRDALSVEVPGYQFTNAYKRGNWDGRKSMLKHNKFRTGLLGMVEKLLQENGLEYSLDGQYGEQHSIPEVGSKTLDNVVLRHYQVVAANTALTSCRGIIRIPTGGGKTEVAAAILHSAIADKRLALFLSGMKISALQPAERFISRGIDASNIAVVGAGRDDTIPNIGVVSATVQTLRNRLNDAWLRNVSVLILDECHHGSAETWLKCADAVDASIRIGLSGTPLVGTKIRDLELIGVTGDVIYDITPKYLADRGYLAKADVIGHTVYTDKIKTVKYARAYSKTIANDGRNGIILDISRNHDTVHLILVNRISHGKLLNNLIADSVFISGSSSDDVRESVLRDMREGKSGNYIATQIFDECVDVPTIGMLTMAGGGKAQHKTIQRAGRALRIHDGNDRVTIHDFVDLGNPNLLEHSLLRFKAYEEMGFDVTILDESHLL